MNFRDEKEEGKRKEGVGECSQRRGQRALVKGVNANLIDIGRLIEMLFVMESCS